MDLVQEQHERAVGDAFIDWYNAQNGTNYVYGGRGSDPPDLIYQAGTNQLFIEIAGSYYDEDNARMLWQHARNVPGAPGMWRGVRPDAQLIKAANAILAKKASKPYPPGCILVVNLYPDITSAEEFEAILADIKVPAQHPFRGIYVTGLFPESS